MSPAWSGCADRARQRDDPLIGSAPHAHGWLLIEHPGPWGVEALAESGIERDVLRSLSAAARAARWRILLVRRPGRRVVTPDRAWIASGPHRTVRGSWRTSSDLLAAASAVRSLSLSSDPGSAAGPAQPGEPVLLVCTHGMHDTCCAVLGRPVAAALADRWPESAWECSHLGGDRFAANVVVLPDAAYYGNLDARSAVSAVEQHLGGRLAIEWLRGLARFPPVAQVAIAEAHRRLGPLAPSAIRADDPEELEPHRWQVAVSIADERWSATVVAERREPATLTCRAAAATPATAYRVVAFGPAPPAAAPPPPTPPESGRR